jgi:hypothetical protein
MEKITLVETRKAVERGSACCGRIPLQAPQRRRSRSFVGGELRETNPRLYFVVCLTCFDLLHIYFASARYTWMCLSLSAGIVTLHVIIYKSYSRT